MADINPAGRRAVEIEIIGDEPETAAPAIEVVSDDESPAGLPKHATRFTDGSIELKLRYPVTLTYRSGADAPVKTEHYDSFRFHRLLGADMRAISAASEDSRAVVAMARSARIREGLMHRVYDRMDGSDIKAAQDIVAFFLGSGRTTGR
jgi:hypothetical protein